MPRSLAHRLTLGSVVFLVLISVAGLLILISFRRLDSLRDLRYRYRHPPDQLSHLFRDFVQGDSSVSVRYGGTGLGLAISKHFCRMMGGDVTVVSEVNRGATFTVRLLLRAAPAPASKRAGPDR